MTVPSRGISSSSQAALKQLEYSNFTRLHCKPVPFSPWPQPCEFAREPLVPRFEALATLSTLSAGLDMQGAAKALYKSTWIQFQYLSFSKALSRKSPANATHLASLAPNGPDKATELQSVDRARHHLPGTSDLEGRRPQPRKGIFHFNELQQIRSAQREITMHLHMHCIPLHLLVRNGVPSSVVTKAGHAHDITWQKAWPKGAKSRQLRAFSSAAGSGALVI